MDKFKPKKSLGQNFLINENIRRRIIESCDLTKDDVVLEIGPGKGALTDLIAPRVKKLIAVETDRILAQELQIKYKDTHVEIIHEDILRYDFTKLPENIKVIGNLPYNISTPIIEKVLTSKEKFNQFYLTVQLEYGKRLAAKHSTKDYSSLSCFVRYYCETKILFRIGRAAFNPMPKVYSCFVRLDIRKTPLIQVDNEKDLFRIIRIAFGQRRKTIENALSKIESKTKLKEIFKKLNLDIKKRPENLSLEDYGKLVGEINFLSPNH